jgi:hypothetical protein
LRMAGGLAGSWSGPAYWLKIGASTVGGLYLRPHPGQSGESEPRSHLEPVRSSRPPGSGSGGMQWQKDAKLGVLKP